MLFDGRKKEVASAPLFTAPVSPDRRRAEAWFHEQVRMAKKHGPHALVGKLTPALAELLLAVNPDNRNLSDIYTAMLAEVIERGDFVLNGETIVISEDGLLNDGQNRCSAVVASGRAIWTVFVFGIKREARFTQDQGRKRALGDMLKMKGVLNHNYAAHATKVLYAYDRGWGAGGKTVDVTRLAEYYEANTAIQASLTPARAVYERVGGSIGLYAAVHLIFSRINQKQADAFFTGLAEAIGTTGRSDPVIKLRNMILAAQRDGTSLSDNNLAAAMIKAWLMRRKKIKSGRVEWQPGEDFPVAE